MYRAKVCSQEFWSLLSGLDIQLEQSKNDNPAKNQFKVARYDNFTNHKNVFYCIQIHICGLVMKATCSELGDMGLIATVWLRVLKLFAAMQALVGVMMCY